MKDWIARSTIKLPLIGTILSSICLAAVVSALGLGVGGSGTSAPDGVKLEILSVRIMSESEELRLCPDCFGHDVAVRLRLSTTKGGFYFYAFNRDAEPLGYTVKNTDHGYVWLYGKELPSSPGIEEMKKLYHDRVTWNICPRHGAIEWEETDTTGYAGQKHAFTVFVKKDEKDKPSELISDSYVVPAPGGRPSDPKAK
jgi:hypothetical protein